MVISSLLIETMENQTEAVAKKLSNIEGVEVHHIEGYKIIITVEAETIDQSYDITKEFINIEGVIIINLIYCNFEDDPTLQQKVM